MAIDKKKKGKNIIICLDGTGNQHGEDKSNVLHLFRMLEREPGKQVAYYDPGVGTMGDPAYKTAFARKINKVLGLAFGRGLMKNLIEAYTFLMENYEDGDKVFIFGFSRGAYTARALAAFIKNCGLFDSSAKNLLPYAMSTFLKKAPKDGKKRVNFFKGLSSFRSTYGRLLNHEEDPKNPKSKNIPNYQLRIHFLGLFDTVKSYGWISNPVVLRNEKTNPSVLKLRHAISIDEKRKFFRQMHWDTSKTQDCKEVWFAGDHSDVGGSHLESESGLAKIALKWMTHEAITSGMKIKIESYSRTMQGELDDNNNLIPLDVKEESKRNYSGPDPIAKIHGETLNIAWKLVQFVPKKLEPWEIHKGMRTIKSEQKRQSDHNFVPILLHKSVLDRVKNDNIKYEPKNLSIENEADKIPYEIEQTISIEETFTPIELELLRKKRPEEKEIDRLKETKKRIIKEIKERKEIIEIEYKIKEIKERKEGIEIIEIEYKIKERKKEIKEIKEKIEIKETLLEELKKLLSLEEKLPSLVVEKKDALLKELEDLQSLKKEKDALLKELKDLLSSKKDIKKSTLLEELEKLLLSEKDEIKSTLLDELKDFLKEPVEELSTVKEKNDALFKELEKLPPLKQLEGLLLKSVKELPLLKEKKDELLKELKELPSVKEKKDFLLEKLQGSLNSSIEKQNSDLKKLEEFRKSFFKEP